MFKIVLYRKVKNNIRYYSLSLYKNLFNEYIVERIYGNCCYKKHIGNVIEIFSDFDSAKHKFEQILNNKKHKGYLENIN